MPTASYLIAAMAAAIGLSAAGLQAHGQDAEIQTTYATERGACGGGAETRVEIAEGRINGLDFDCVLATPRPAGTGLVAYDATCMIDGNTWSDGIALDLGNYEDHFKLALPGREGWLALYPCTLVPGLSE
jgi:hypothetical protein